MSDVVPIRISQYGAIADAEVARDELLGDAPLAELAQELHRQAVWACLQNLGSDCALSWRQILSRLEETRAELKLHGATLPGEEADMSDSSVFDLNSLESASC